MSNTSNDLKILLENPVVIYGAGKGAFRIILNLKALNANIIGLAVSDISDNRTLGFDGFEVKTPEAYEAYKDTAVVLIATSEKYQDEIKSKCMRLGFKNIVLHSHELMELASETAHKKLLIKHGLSLEGDIITVRNGKYLNPYSAIFSEKFGIVDQWEDICSTAFGDMSMSYEGPYEYGAAKISAGDVVLDIGASIGYVSVYAASKGAEAYAFEPSPENHSLIKCHSEMNGNMIHLEPYAVSNECGTAEFWINLNCNTASSFDAHIAGEKSPMTVSQITIDEFVKQEKLVKVDYIHANAIGAERLVLQGASETLRKFAPKIAICTYQKHDDKEVLADIILRANPNYKIEYKCNKLYAHV